MLLGLIDLCLEDTDRFGEPPQMVTTTQLAEKVVDLYWRQTAEFSPGAGVLRHNSGRNAVIVSRIRELRDGLVADPGAPLHRVRVTAPAAYRRLLADVEWTLVLMPLPKVQRFGGREDRFIYEIGWDDGILYGEWRDTARFGNRITFVGDAADHLVRLSPVLRPLIQQR